MEFTITFIRIFLWGVYLTSPILLIMAFLIIFLGLIVGRVESWTKFDSIYWCFITALTVGYGDIKPTRKVSKILSVILGLIGLIFAGILVAIAVKATTISFEIHTAPQITESMKSSIK